MSDLVDYLPGTSIAQADGDLYRAGRTIYRSSSFPDVSIKKLFSLLRSSQESGVRPKLERRSREAHVGSQSADTIKLNFRFRRVARLCSVVVASALNKHIGRQRRRVFVGVRCAMSLPTTLPSRCRLYAMRKALKTG